MNQLLLAAAPARELQAGTFTEYMWLVPLLPMASFAIILFFGKKLPGKGSSVGIAAVGAAFVLSVMGFVELAGGKQPVHASWTWFEYGRLELEFGMNYDFLCGVMFVVVTAVSLLVQIYSIGYMHDDTRFTWFYAALSLFTGSMLFLVVANNLLQMFVGWELVGLCSYFLIGHYWEEKENSSAAVKAFITTRVGDVSFLFGIWVLFIAGDTFNVVELNDLAEDGALAGTALTLGALLLFFGAVGKSAQFPLHVWLPDAMAGPTPVSALIHAATMVVAGIYLVARMFVLFEHAGGALNVVAVVAAVTMLMAAVLALVQDDIKRVLAYSTISQLAYMMAALGVGAYTASVFHLFTHAFFKALLFLAAGSVLHSVHSNNMSEMGGLRKHMPQTFWTFMIGSAALAGIFPLAGFFSKDEIIGEALRSASEGRQAVAAVVFVAAALTALLTALYMTRAVVKTFFGEYRGHAAPRESPAVMTGPLWVLGAASVAVGFLGFPIVGPFPDWIRVAAEERHGFSTVYNVLLPLGSMAIAAAGIWLGWQVFSRNRWRVDLLAGTLAWLYRFVANKYYLDDIYLRFIVRPVQYTVARATYWTNQRILDGAVDGSASAALATARVTYYGVDQQVVDYAVNGAAGITGMTGGLLRYIQTGNVQRYAAVLFAAVAVFVALLVLA